MVMLNRVDQRNTPEICVNKSLKESCNRADTTFKSTPVEKIEEGLYSLATNVSEQVRIMLFIGGINVTKSDNGMHVGLSTAIGKPKTESRCTLRNRGGK
jgi:hypothetical protein